MSAPTKRFVFVTNLHPKVKPSLTKIKALSLKLLALLKQKKELHLTFVSNAQIRLINQTFHGTNLSTDVLAFEAPRKWPKHRPFLGEIIISIDHAVQYAKHFHIQSDEELLRYIVHGALHLLGERDHLPRLKEKMFRRQEKLIRELSPIPKLIEK